MRLITKLLPFHHNFRVVAPNPETFSQRAAAGLFPGARLEAGQPGLIRIRPAIKAITGGLSSRQLDPASTKRF
jgi:hypothetical protein